MLVFAEQNERNLQTTEGQIQFMTEDGRLS
jgi:hypothetical protein